MEKQNSPGLWIAAAALSAVLVVMLATPGKKPEPPVTVTPPEQIKRTAETPATTIPQPPTESPAATPTIPPVAAIPSKPALPRDPDDPIPPLKPITPADRDNTLRVLDNIQFALRDYRSALGENPVGTNAEITSSLLGNNRKQAKVPLPDGATLNGLGELCDPWGTPYFFHQQSATRMEIRSAGPDHKMWTADDVLM